MTLEYSKVLEIKNLMIKSQRILFHLKKDPVKLTIENYYFGVHEIRFSFDNKKINIIEWKEILEDKNILKIISSSKNTYKYLKAIGIDLEGIWDIEIVHYLITGISLNCKEILKNLNCKMQEIHSIQENLIIKKNIEKIVKLELASIPAFGDIEYYGMNLDKKNWLSLFDENSIKLDNIKKILDNYLIESNLIGEDHNGNIDFNWNSTIEVSSILKELFPDIKNSSDEEIERIYLKYNKNFFLDNLRKYRSLVKNIGTYGIAYVEHINSKTKKFHPNINQIGCVTGRPSSNKPNILNIPKKKEFRSCWKADEKSNLIICDYSYCELAIAAYLSGDQNLIEAFHNGLDPHILTASNFLEINYNKALSLYHNLDEKIMEYRNIAKVFNFALIYGMSEKTMVSKYHLKKEIVQKSYQIYKRKYKVLMNWLEIKGNEGVKKRQIRTALGRIRYFNSSELLHFSEISDIKRAAANTVVQGTSADITKLAMVLIRNKTIKQKLYPDVRLYLQIYDEILVHSKSEYAEIAKKITEECMERASNIILGNNFKIKANAIIADNWGNF